MAMATEIAFHLTDADIAALAASRPNTPVRGQSTNSTHRPQNDASAADSLVPSHSTRVGFNVNNPLYIAPDANTNKRKKTSTSSSSQLTSSIRRLHAHDDDDDAKQDQEEDTNHQNSARAFTSSPDLREIELLMIMAIKHKAYKVLELVRWLCVFNDCCFTVESMEESQFAALGCSNNLIHDPTTFMNFVAVFFSMCCRVDASKRKASPSSLDALGGDNDNDNEDGRSESSFDHNNENATNPHATSPPIPLTGIHLSRRMSRHYHHHRQHHVYHNQYDQHLQFFVKFPVKDVVLDKLNHKVVDYLLCVLVDYMYEAGVRGHRNDILKALRLCAAMHLTYDVSVSFLFRREFPIRQDVDHDLDCTMADYIFNVIHHLLCCAGLSYVDCPLFAMREWNWIRHAHNMMVGRGVPR